MAGQDPQEDRDLDALSGSGSALAGGGADAAGTSPGDLGAPAPRRDRPDVIGGPAEPGSPGAGSVEVGDAMGTGAAGEQGGGTDLGGPTGNSTSAMIGSSPPGSPQDVP